MFDTKRQQGAQQIVELAHRVATELASDTGRSIRVVGWIGSGGKMDWEYAVEIEGNGYNLEVGDSDLLAFPRDERVRVEIAERIRYQMRCALEMASRARRGT
jgi:hypothetical protein